MKRVLVDQTAYLPTSGIGPYGLLLSPFPVRSHYPKAGINGAQALDGLAGKASKVQSNTSRKRRQKWCLGTRSERQQGVPTLS